jgi:glyoxylase-like metal-dependent hydrolase (beta-lactamase superfamily II)
MLSKLTLALAAACVLHAQPQQNFDSVEIRVLPVQGNVSMLIGAGGNITLQNGKDGVLLVDTQFAQMAPKIMKVIRGMTDEPIRWIVNTHVHPDHVGGNEALLKLGMTPASVGPPRIVAHENVLNRMTSPAAKGETPGATAGAPNDEYFTKSKDFFFNGEAVVVYHERKAHTDGDSVVFFRRSDVISTGDIFTPEIYPIIDLERGGSVQGLIDALNHIIELAVPAKYQEGGTYIIPGHGRLCEEADVVEYRDMVTIIRDRVEDLIKKGMTLAQVKAARPTLDYDTRYGATTGFWTTDMFVGAMYKSLGGTK